MTGRNSGMIGRAAVASVLATLALCSSIAQPAFADRDGEEPVAEAPEPAAEPADEESVAIGDVDGSDVAVAAPPVPPAEIVVEVGLAPVPPVAPEVEVAVGLPPVPPADVVVAVGRPPVPAPPAESVSHRSRGKSSPRPHALASPRPAVSVDQTTTVLAEAASSVDAAAALICDRI